LNLFLGWGWAIAGASRSVLRSYGEMPVVNGRRGLK
jgi:hypothetical protein